MVEEFKAGKTYRSIPRFITQNKRPFFVLKSDLIKKYGFYRALTSQYWELLLVEVHHKKCDVRGPTMRYPGYYEEVK